MMTNRELIHHEIDSMSQEELTEVYTAIQEVRKRNTSAHKHRFITSSPRILDNEPIIVGTRTPVRAIVENWRLGIPPEEIPQHLPHLTLAQVFDALSYYSEHQDEINDHIERNRVSEEQIDPLVKSL